MCVTINWPGAVPNSQEQGGGRGKREFSLLPESESFSDSVIAKQSRAGKKEGGRSESSRIQMFNKVVLRSSVFIYRETERGFLYFFFFIFPNSQGLGRARERESKFQMLN